MHPQLWMFRIGGVFMKYSYEYKKKCVELYKLPVNIVDIIAGDSSGLELHRLLARVYLLQMAVIF